MLVTTRYALRDTDSLHQRELDALNSIVDTLETAEAASVAALGEDPRYLYGSPGEAMEALFSGAWCLYGEQEVSIPLHLHDSNVLQYNTVILTRDDIFMACRVRGYDTPPRGSRERVYDWRGLNALQRFNALLAEAGNFVVGFGPDGLFSALARTVDEATYGADPTNWIAAARLLAARSAEPEADPTTREGIDHAVFLAQLGCPRFSALYGS